MENDIKNDIVTMSGIELRRLILNVSKYATKETLLQLGAIKPQMKISECYKLSSRRKVDRAIQDGKLKFTRKGANMMIDRASFDAWINTHEFI